MHSPCQRLVPATPHPHAQGVGAPGAISQPHHMNSPACGAVREGTPVRRQGRRRVAHLPLSLVYQPGFPDDALNYIRPARTTSVVRNPFLWSKPPAPSEHQRPLSCAVPLRLSTPTRRTRCCESALWDGVREPDYRPGLPVSNSRAPDLQGDLQGEAARQGHRPVLLVCVLTHTNRHANKHTDAHANTHTALP